MAARELQLVARLLAASILVSTQVSWTSGEQIYMHGHSLLQVRQQHGEQRSFGASAPMNILDMETFDYGANAPLSGLYDTERKDSFCAKAERLRSCIAPLNETGYQDVASICCRYDMALFIERAVKHEEYEVCSVGGLQGVVWWFDCPADNRSYADLLKVFAKATGGDCPWLRRKGDLCKQRAKTCPSFSDSYPPEPCTNETTTRLETTTTAITTRPRPVAPQSQPLQPQPVAPQARPLPPQTGPVPPQSQPVTTTALIQSQPVPTTTTLTSEHDCVVELYGFHGWIATYTCCEPGQSIHEFRGGKWFRDFRRQGARNDDTKRLNVYGHGCEALLYDGGQFTGWHATFQEGNYTAREYKRAGAFKGVSSVKVAHKT